MALDKLQWSTCLRVRIYSVTSVFVAISLEINRHYISDVPHMLISFIFIENKMHNIQMSFNRWKSYFSSFFPPIKVDSALFGISLLLKRFENIQNRGKSECTRLEQRSIIKFLLVEKCKPCEIYNRLCDVYGEAYFSKKKIFPNGLNVALPLSLNWKHSQ